MAFHRAEKAIAEGQRKAREKLRSEM